MLDGLRAGREGRTQLVRVELSSGASQESDFPSDRSARARLHSPAFATQLAAPAKHAFQRQQLLSPTRLRYPTRSTS